jgi:hypothetical protein
MNFNEKVKNIDSLTIQSGRVSLQSANLKLEPDFGTFIKIQKRERFPLEILGAPGGHRRKGHLRLSYTKYLT